MVQETTNELMSGRDIETENKIKMVSYEVYKERGGELPEEFYKEIENLAKNIIGKDRALFDSSLVCTSRLNIDMYSLNLLYRTAQVIQEYYSIDASGKKSRADIVEEAAKCWDFSYQQREPSAEI